MQLIFITWRSSTSRCRCEICYASHFIILSGAININDVLLCTLSTIATFFLASLLLDAPKSSFLASFSMEATKGSYVARLLLSSLLLAFNTYSIVDIFQRCTSTCHSFACTSIHCFIVKEPTNCSDILA